MKKYIRNLWTALTGRNPYQLELDGVREEFENAKAELLQISQKVSELEKAHAQIHGMFGEDAKTSDGLMQLVENLRERIGEKDELIRQMREDYRKCEKAYKERIAGYSQQIADLQKGRKKPRRKFKTEKRS